MTPSIGPLVAEGRTSDVYALGADSVVKVLRPGVPTDWLALEAAYTTVVRALGVPAPEVREEMAVEGRPAVVFERVVGPSLWEHIVERPCDLETLAEDLVQIQRQIQEAGVPDGVPNLVDRMCSKIAAAEPIEETERREAADLVRSLPSGAALLHGDLHPGNVLMSADGPVVIDWFDVTVGHPAADFVRSALLMRPSEGRADLPHLSGATDDLRRQLHHAYVRSMLAVVDVADDVLLAWEPIVAASRLSEGAELDDAPLINVWASRRTPDTSPLAEAVSRARRGRDE